jgi:hypothetical protein
MRADARLTAKDVSMEPKERLTRTMPRKGHGAVQFPTCRIRAASRNQCSGARTLRQDMMFANDSSADGKTFG